MPIADVPPDRAPAALWAIVRSSSDNTHQDAGGLTQ